MPPPTNLNAVARRLTLEEGRKVSLPIGQVKEVLRLALRWLAELEPEEVARVLRRHRGRA